MSFVMLKQGDPDRVDTGVVSANFFEMLGIAPPSAARSSTRTTTSEWNRSWCSATSYWQRKFGGDQNVVGKIVEMNDHMHTIVGVLPPFPQYPRENDVYMPTSACPFRAAAASGRCSRTTGRSAGLRVFGRLAPGATADRATTEVRTIATGFDEAYPRDVPARARVHGDARSRCRSSSSAMRGRCCSPCSGATTLVLLIACANVANLALARAVRRGPRDGAAHRARRRAGAAAAPARH